MRLFWWAKKSEHKIIWLCVLFLMVHLLSILFICANKFIAILLNSWKHFKKESQVKYLQSFWNISFVDKALGNTIWKPQIWDKA